LREDEVIGKGLVVIQEVVLDGLGFVPETKDEFVVAEVGEILH
jgi:hypothetical protein